jgi:hypothetical protein
MHPRTVRCLGVRWLIASAGSRSSVYIRPGMTIGSPSRMIPTGCRSESVDQEVNCDPAGLAPHSPGNAAKAAPTSSVSALGNAAAHRARSPPSRATPTRRTLRPDLGLAGALEATSDSAADRNLPVDDADDSASSSWMCPWTAWPAVLAQRRRVRHLQVTDLGTQQPWPGTPCSRRSCQLSLRAGPRYGPSPRAC